MTPPPGHTEELRRKQAAFEASFHALMADIERRPVSGLVMRTYRRLLVQPVANPKDRA